MDIYSLLQKLTDGSQLGETDKQAAREVIHKLKVINAFGSAAASAESDTDETQHVHIKETQWDKFSAGKLIDMCRECGEKLSAPYDPQYVGGNSQYFRR